MTIEPAALLETVLIVDDPAGITYEPV